MSQPSARQCLIMVWGTAWDKLLKEAAQIRLLCLGEFTCTEASCAIPLALTDRELNLSHFTVSIDSICFSKQFPHIFNFKGHRSLFFADPCQQLMLRQLFILFTMSLWASLFPSVDLSIPSVWPKIFVLSDDFILDHVKTSNPESLEL